MAVFGYSKQRTDSDVEPAANDRNADGVDDRVQGRGQAATGDGTVYDSRTQRPDEGVDQPVHETRGSWADDDVRSRERIPAPVTERVGTAPATERVGTERVDGEPATERIDTAPVTERVDTMPANERATAPVSERVGPAPVAEQRRGRPRASLLATLSLIVGLSATYASLSGRLAPVGIALGVIGLLFAIGGLSASGRPRVAGASVAVLALLLSIAGVVFGVLAIRHTTTWLDSSVDQVSRARDWLDAQLPFIKGW
jgi:hypothetical protein